MALTDRQIEALKPEGERVALRDDGRGGVAGLELRLSKGGAKTWCVRYTLPDGTRRRLTLGRYPALSLAAARDAAVVALAAVAQNGDPAGEKKKARLIARTREVKTLVDLAEVLFEAGGVRDSTMAYRKWLWAKHLKPRLGDTRIDDVASGLVRRAIRDIGVAAGPTTANRALGLLQRMFNFGVEEEHFTANPLARIKPMFDEESRDRVLTDDELKALWKVAIKTSEPTRQESSKDRDELAVSRAMAIGIQLCLLTAQRAGEVCGITRAELDLDARTWVLPAERSKSKREHLVPLSDTAVELIKEAWTIAQRRLERDRAEGEDVTKTRNPKPTDPLFPSPRGSLKPVERLSLSRAMERLTEAAKIEDATPHDLRRTAATAMASERIGALTEVVARVLNHAPPGLGVTGIYNRHAYVSEKRRALEAWEAVLLEIVGERERTDNVRTFLRSA